MTLEYVKQGDRVVRHLTSNNWNTIVESALAHKQGKLSGTSSIARNSPALIQVKNGTGSDLNRFAVVGLGTPLGTGTIEDFKNAIVFTGVTPDIDNHKGKFAVLQQPLADTEVGLAAVDGMTICQIAVGNTSHHYAEITHDDSDKLTSGFVGSSKIIWAEDGTGDKWAIVLLGVQDNQSLVGVVTSQIGAKSGNTIGSGTVEIHEVYDGDLITTGDSVTAYNMCGDSIAVDNYVQLKTIGDRLYVDTVCCTNVPYLSS